LTTIGDSAFLNCASITGGLDFSDSITSIGNNAFDGCTGLTGNLTIGQGLETIGDNAFSGVKISNITNHLNPNYKLVQSGGAMMLVAADHTSDEID
jgi:hypothetical protein